MLAELVRAKLSADRVFLRQREDFRSVNPAGWNAFGSQYERVLPASSVANLFPFNYSGKTDPHGFYVGKDRYGSGIIVALDPEHEMVDLCRNLGGCFIDLMSGRYIINPLEPKVWDVDGEDDEDAPAVRDPDASVHLPLRRRG